MTLSAEILNLRSPYQLTQINDMTFSFVTDKQIHYNVGFYKDTYFMDEGAYHFFIDNSEHEHGSYDPKILDTVTVILEEFFSQEPTVMLYICDPTDKRQAACDRLYSSATASPSRIRSTMPAFSCATTIPCTT